jgi:hypothetical protein
MCNYHHIRVPMLPGKQPFFAMPTAVQLPLFLERQRRRPPAPLERRATIAIADLLRTAAKPGWWWSHIPSGELRTEKTGALLQRMGLKPGMADFLFVGPGGRLCFLELKRSRGGRLSPAQKEFREEMERRGVPYAVAGGFDQAVEVLQSWGVLRAIRVQ